MTKRIEYDRITKDFNVYVDDNYVGSRPTRSEAEALANEAAYRALGGK